MCNNNKKNNSRLKIQKLIFAKLWEICHCHSQLTNREYIATFWEFFQL